MTCYHPAKGFLVGTLESGKQDIKYKGYGVEYLVSGNQTIWKNKYNKIDENLKNKLIKVNDYLYKDDSPYPCYYAFDYLTLPCGQCLGCRIQKSRDWANRMMLEAQYHENNYFITLTYDDEHLQKLCKREYVDDDGVIHESYSLDKRHFQLFMKRLRKAVEVHDPFSGKVLDYSKIRFYAAGEYGSRSFRPHYHFIAFGLVLPDLKYLKRSPEGYVYYTSELLSKLWPFGFHTVTQVTWETCAYTARYVTKKLNGDKASFYEVFNIAPEFSLMSRKPGIGFEYYMDKGREVYQDGTYIIRLSTDKGPISFKPPRYYDTLFDVEDSETLKDIKANQVKMAENATALKLTKTDLSYLELLEVEERNFKRKTLSLVRSDV